MMTPFGTTVARALSGTTAALLLGLTACARPVLPRDHSTTTALLPGGDLLVRSMRGDSSAFARRRVFVLFQRALGPDTAERKLAETNEEDRFAASNSADLTLTSRWSPPYESSDSLIVDGNTLRPLDEVIESRRARYRFHYDGPRVTGVVAVADSAPQRLDRKFDQPVFAFNEVEILVRSLRYRVGLRVVVPLFSEGDRAIEHDTLSVVSQSTQPDHAPVWTIEFADPVITTRYRVDARSREIIDAVTRQRKSGLTFRLARADTASGQ